MSFPKRWCGKLFHSLMILTKKEYLKVFTFADFTLDDQVINSHNNLAT